MKMYKNRKKFTLLELLICVAIIAILASLLLPSLNKARQMAQKAVCTGNQKQLLLGLIQYMGDFNGYGCPGKFNKGYYLGDNYFAFWIEMLIGKEYLGKVPFEEKDWGLQSPSKALRSLISCPGLKKKDTNVINQHGGYGMFYAKADSDFGKTLCYDTGQLGDGGWGTATSGAYFSSKLKSPSELGYIGCSAKMRSGDTGGDQYFTIPQGSVTSWDKCAAAMPDAAMYGAFAFAHTQTGNMGMADGSVRSWSYGTYLTKLNNNAGIGYRNLFKLFPFNRNYF